MNIWHNKLPPHLYTRHTDSQKTRLMAKHKEGQANTDNLIEKILTAKQSDRKEGSKNNRYRITIL